VGRNTALGRGRCGRGGASQGRSGAGATKTGSNHPTTPQRLRTRTPAWAQRRITEPQSRELTSLDAPRERRCLEREHVCTRAQGRRGREPLLRPRLSWMFQETTSPSATTNETMQRPFATMNLRLKNVHEHVSGGFLAGMEFESLSSCPDSPTALARALPCQARRWRPLTTAANISPRLPCYQGHTSVVSASMLRKIYIHMLPSFMNYSNPTIQHQTVRTTSPIDISVDHQSQQHYTPKVTLVRE
jgi:hypothetical protein